MKKEAILAFAFLILLVSGADSCQQTGGGLISGGKIDFSLTQSIDTLTAGKSIEQGQQFYVQAKVSNPGEIKTGKVCISDNIGENYGGISSSSLECQPFSVSDGNSELIFGPYTYSNIPTSSASAVLFVYMDYNQKSRAESAVNVPLPEFEMMNLRQGQDPILVSVNKSIRRQDQGYKVDLGISLKPNSPSDAKMKIFSPDFSKENLSVIEIIMGEQALDCVSGIEKISREANIGREKFIRCSTISNLGKEEQSLYPFVLTLDYGVRVSREYQFTIIKP